MHFEARSEQIDMDIRLILKDYIVPNLRTRGFSGSFPHFRRTSGSTVQLISFQLDKYGTGNFVIELAKAPNGPLTESWGKVIEANKVTARHINNRLRLGATEIGSDQWFQHEDFVKDPVTTTAYLLSMLDNQGAIWWQNA